MSLWRIFNLETGWKPIRNQLFVPWFPCIGSRGTRFFTTSFTIGGAFRISPRCRESLSVSAKMNGKKDYNDLQGEFFPECQGYHTLSVNRNPVRRGKRRYPETAIPGRNKIIRTIVFFKRLFSLKRNKTLIIWTESMVVISVSDTRSLSRANNVAHF